jgi:hypothetical protein
VPTSMRHGIGSSLRSAAVRATLATSYLGTEPWRLVLREDALEVHADRSRRLSALDPVGRQLVISCGAALLNARVTLAAAGSGVVVDLFPEPVEPDFLARLTLDPRRQADLALGLLDAAVDPSPAAYADGANARRGRAAAGPVRIDGVEISAAWTPEQVLAIGQLSRTSLMEQESDPAREVELRAWRPQGPESRTFADEQTWLVVSTPGDTRSDWMAVGEAVQQLILQTRVTDGMRAHPHVVETPHARERLQRTLALDTMPQALLQIGLPVTSAPSRRRRLADVLSVAP